METGYQPRSQWKSDATVFGLCGYLTWGDPPFSLAFLLVLPLPFHASSTFPKSPLISISLPLSFTFRPLSICSFFHSPFPSANPARGSGERCKLPQQGLGRKHGRSKRVLTHLRVSKCASWQHLLAPPTFPMMQNASFSPRFRCPWSLYTPKD